jgi:choline kinase
LKWHPAPDALLFDPRRPLRPEERKVRLAGPYVVDMSKDLPADPAAGENVGLLKFDEDGASRLAEVLDRLVAAGAVKAWAPPGGVELAHRWPVVGIETDGLPWTEVDDPADLHYANRVIAPAVDASLLPSAVELAAGAT